LRNHLKTLAQVRLEVGALHAFLSMLRYIARLGLRPGR
jgi:hypothetical protein